MECHGEKNDHSRHLFLFAFNQGYKATKSSRNICAVHRESVIAGKTTHNLYIKFKDEILMKVKYRYKIGKWKKIVSLYQKHI